MAFKKISLEKYIELHLINNLTEHKADLEKRLINALEDFKNGIKCSCGNDIWVIGSAIKKRENREGQRHINDIPLTEIHGFFSDDGYEINMDLIKKPTLCLTCIHDNDPNEEILCNLTRLDQQGEPDFECFSYKKINF